MMRRIGLFLAGVFLLGLCVHGFARADRDRLLKAAGRVPATVVRVIDADTVVVDAEPWPDVIISKISVRVDGVDTPEKSGSGCVTHYKKLGRAVPDPVKARENQLGCIATAFVAGSDKLKLTRCKALRDGGQIKHQAGLLRPGDWVILSDLKAGKYAQRVVANLLYPVSDGVGGLDFESLGERLIKERLAVPYGGGTKEAWWCNADEEAVHAGSSR